MIILLVLRVIITYLSRRAACEGRGRDARRYIRF